MASCYACGLPISGRTVSIADFPDKFHPHCLRCETCGIGLEAMELSPEPESVRLSRITPSERDNDHNMNKEVSGNLLAEENRKLRFYCHLDWHELFSPRCGHCHTPIIGEHLVALGGYWHYGHFFCAQCGEPFDKDSVHIVKNGYPWCTRCDDRATQGRNPKCKKCNLPVLEKGIVALGGEWHLDCMSCISCSCSLKDEEVFLNQDETGNGVGFICKACRIVGLKQ